MDDPNKLIPDEELNEFESTGYVPPEVVDKNLGSSSLQTLEKPDKPALFPKPENEKTDSNALADREGDGKKQRWKNPDLQEEADKQKIEELRKTLAPQTITVEVDGETVTLEVMETDMQLEETKALDDKAFGEHQGIPLDVLKEFTVHGRVIGIRDQSGKLMGEAQVSFDQIPTADERLIRELPPNAAYFEGFGVDPDAQNQGYGKRLMKGVEDSARERDKEEMYATVRAENGASVKALTRGGG